MKIRTLTLAALMTAMAGTSASAFTISLQGDILLNGVSNTSGDALSDGSGLLRFGFFNTLSDASITANKSDLGALELDFVEVARTDTFFAGFAGFSSENYVLVADGAPAAEFTNYTDNIAGKSVMLWAFNENTVGASTQHGIFATDAVFASGLDDTNAQTAFSIDDGTAGLRALAGTLGTGPDIGGGVSSHQLEAIPEPMASLLVTLSGLALIFRRRR